MTFSMAKVYEYLGTCVLLFFVSLLLERFDTHQEIPAEFQMKVTSIVIPSQC